MFVIILVILVLWIVLFAWSFHSLGTMDVVKKIPYMIVGVAVVFGITFLIYQFSKIGIVYPNGEIQHLVQMILLFVFTAMNGYFILPFLFKTIDLGRQNSIEKEQIQKRLLILLVLFILLVILECNYLKGTQQSILRIMDQLKP